MKKAILYIYRTFRSIAVAVLLLLAVLYSVLYVVLSIPAVQDKVRAVAEQELSGLFHVNFTINKVSISPVNEVIVSGITLPDTTGATLATIEKVGAGLSMYHLIFNHRIVFNYAELIGLNANIRKATPNSPTNLQFIIDAVRPEKKDTTASRFDLALNAIVIRKSTISYDVLSEPALQERFDKNHFTVNHINSDIRIPKLENQNFDIEIKRFTFTESHGLDLHNLSLDLKIRPDSILAENIKIQLPNSILIPEDISLKLKSPDNHKSDIFAIPIDFRMANSYVTLSDFQAFMPLFRNFNDPIYITCALKGTLKHLDIETIDIQTDDSRLTLKTSGTIAGLNAPDSLQIRIPNIILNADMKLMLERTQGMSGIPAAAADKINSLGFIALNGSLNSNPTRTVYIGNISTSLGTITTDGILTHPENSKRKNFTGKIKTTQLHLSQILPEGNRLLGDAAFDINLNTTFSDKADLRGTVTGAINYIDLKGYRYHDIRTDLQFDPSNYEGVIMLNDPNIDLYIGGLAQFESDSSNVDIDISLNNVSLSNLNLSEKYPDNRLSAKITTNLSGHNINDIEGDLLVSDIQFTDSTGNGLKMDHFDISARKNGNKRLMTLNSDIVNGSVRGNIDLENIISDIKDILSTAFPVLFTPATDKARTRTANNDFSFEFRLAEDRQFCDFFHLPVKVVHPINVSGTMNDSTRKFALGIDAPYIMNGNKIIEKTSLSLNVDGTNDLLSLNVVSQLDHKDGNILFLFNGNAANNRIDTDINWHYDRKRNFSGNINLSAGLSNSSEEGTIETAIDINPTTFTVNDTTWQIESAKVIVKDKKIYLSDINVNREGQFIKANGAISDSYDDEVKLQLQDIDLGYIFETLNINHVAFGGTATGDFFASGVLSSAPQLNTSNLHVRQFTYHKALLGDADIKSYWDNEGKGIVINADIHQQNSRETYVRGVVYPTRDSLAFKFNADKVNVQIIRPFLSAFASDISGTASGEAELYGTFKLINMRGRLFADQFRMKLNFTNTYYTVSDSIIMDPGIIRINEATVYDANGHTARLSGTVRHSYFKKPLFNFNITDIDNMLCFNTDAKLNPLWYGTVYANGAVFVKGEPGIVNIDLNVEPAPNSSFSFVLSDQEEAGEYTFITFTDKRKEERLKLEQEKKPDFLTRLQAEQQQDTGTPSIFNMNLLVDINPNLAVTLVMDPNGGDRIRTTGNGNLRIEYSSTDEMKMFGNYTVQEGRYNFTLQDIIIREFSIKEGGTISFHGNPKEANVNLSAVYSVNANLQDLDESFADDKELNRTTVPVNALLNLSGSISQPSISFDLEFPTLTQDVYRKVRSIISTDDMMNQQIIYLLALSRFYTPEYMGNTNSGSELASVASSTISSQLSNMLGQLSDKWSIAPNFHTDKGDFSDMEVELALSSRLLNNRLLLNGNFGYSDNALNSNNFIGDFDIEYLLTKSGNIRLRAYNRYNDQNYYIRNSLTTQGVGIVFKHDFDRIFKKRKRQPDKTRSSQPTDTIPDPGTDIQAIDSLHQQSGKRKPAVR